MSVMQTSLITQEPMHSGFLHVKEAAAQLGVHPSTVRRHIHDGDLEAVRLGRGGRYRVSRKALEDFLRPVTTTEGAS